MPELGAISELFDVSSLPKEQIALRVGLLGLGLVGTWATLKLVRSTLDFVRINRGLSTVPSAPGYNWLLGHVIPLIKCVQQKKGAWDLMEEWIKERGPLVKFRILGTQGVALRDPVALKRIFQTGQRIYEKELDLSYRPFLPILGTGLVTADGELWQKQRLLMGPVLRADMLDDIIPIAKRGTDRLCAKLEKIKGTGKSIDIEEEFRLLTLQIIGDAVLSLSPEECDRVFPALYLPVMEEANKRVLRPYRMYLPLLPAWWQFRSRMARLNDYLITYFRQRWQARLKGLPRPRDILDRVMDSIQEAGTPWDTKLEQQLCFEVKTFLLAGHETSAAMLTWSFFELSQNHDALKKVRDEADKVIGPNDAAPARRDVDGMIYTLAVLKEALRKYSVVPVVTRKLAADDELHGHKLPKGTMIACIIQGTHNLYSQPTVFRPDRFMPGGEFDQWEEGERLFTFVPFIQGPRNCLGQHMALLEARVILGGLARRFTFTPAHPGQDVRCAQVVPVGPVNGMHMVVN
mmetsp:Transcript_26506/g.67408  ORF Transcript_26506/g.67408 Transcript_26506/m.67408 type:complete len:518 (-) Transcript_26506:88-1641(-)|eukprot:CAMPEP_0202868544 /NCGR_PEP_ID=MMETSP1391-20130828/10937_1 /ASSEMBLY_ACC=CAM_ASM_000867 /TAXON_ID=1034604 /ORGANISM="Chlamydomonas leiostraca, Strain SAG 11-49" /LENGTH=517 /DNA_ID=CAMNT_0049548729 /DNA_START=169 /DNA_END=1722 /DNA_ORIENTATION=-